jgi:GNAT superfamily N-acetyltransferase
MGETEMVIEVKKISDFKEVDVSKLIQESEKEGYRFVTRLKEEYEDGTNRFSEQGEALYGVWEDKELVSIGGLTKNTITTEEQSARLYRFYTLPEYRRKGIGSELFKAISENAKGKFKEITTKTESAKADAFYRANGFVFEERSPDTSHVLSL